MTKTVFKNVLSSFEFKISSKKKTEEEIFNNHMLADPGWKLADFFPIGIGHIGTHYFWQRNIAF